MKLSELAVRLGCRLEGDGDIEVSRVARIDTAEPGDVTFLTNPRYASIATLRTAAGFTGAASRRIGVVSVIGVVRLTVAIKPLCYKLVQAYTENGWVEHIYDSFGKQTASSGSMTNPFQYTV